MADDPFIVDGCDVERHSDGAHVRLNFVSDIAGTRSVVLRRDRIPQVLAALQNEIVPGHMTSIDNQSLQIGADYQLEGYQFAKTPNGGLELMMFVNLPDEGGTVTVTLDIPAKDVADLIKPLGGLR